MHALTLKFAARLCFGQVGPSGYVCGAARDVASTVNANGGRPLRPLPGFLFLRVGARARIFGASPSEERALRPERYLGGRKPIYSGKREFL